MDNQTGNSGEELKSRIKDDAQSIKEELRSTTADMAGKAKEQVESGKDSAADTLNELSDAIDQMASSISENDKLGLASYIHGASSRLASLADRLQEKSVDELAQDAKELARRQPAAFLLGSVVLGFGLSRFVKANAGHHADTGRSYRQQDQSRSSPDYSDARPSYVDNAATDTTGASW